MTFSQIAEYPVTPYQMAFYQLNATDLAYYSVCLSYLEVIPASWAAVENVIKRFFFEN
jgi:hypothetical protein